MNPPLPYAESKAAMLPLAELGAYTFKRDDGVVVPIPTLPLESTVRISVEDVPTEKSDDVPVAVDDATERSAVGVVVPIPTFPDPRILIFSVPNV